VTRKGPPDSDSLWADQPADDAGESAPRKAGPPDWALPSWDSIDGTEPAVSATRVGVPSPATPTPAPATPTDEAPWPVTAQTATAAPAPATPVPSESAFALKILGVSEVTRAVRDAVRADASLRDVWVEGEVGRVTVSSAGHCYFTLKDAKSQLACVFFRDDRLASPFEARTGLRVVVHGRIDLFESQGVYQLYVASVQPAGFGDLALQFEALKASLAAQGLFDSARKRPLPYRPAVIGVATSATGAVWHDICQVIGRRWPLTRLVLAPCQVQGEGSAASVVAALDRLARWGDQCRAEGRPDDAPAVVILARGGGSLEDLWSFNDERVVRAVVAHPVPVVCGVGHEVDVTLADFAADVRAPTPSAAAELVVPDRAEVAAEVAAMSRRARSRAAAALLAARVELAAEGRALDRLRPEAQLAQARERAGYLLDRATRCIRDEVGRRRSMDGRLASRLAPAVETRLAAARMALARSHAALGALAPQATLDRGYAIVRRADDGTVVRDPAQAPDGALLAVRVARGELVARVEDRAPEGPRA
jgi:exodeoxyribonuclease VII large subunit